MPPATGALCVGYSHSTFPVRASNAAKICLVVPSKTRSDAVTNTPPLPWRGSSTCQAQLGIEAIAHRLTGDRAALFIKALVPVLHDMRAGADEFAGLAIDHVKEAIFR